MINISNDLKSCSLPINIKLFLSWVTISQKTNCFHLTLTLWCCLGYLQFRPTVSLSILQPYEPSTEVICSLQKNLTALYCTWNHATDGRRKCRLCKVRNEFKIVKGKNELPQNPTYAPPTPVPSFQHKPTLIWGPIPNVHH